MNKSNIFMMIIINVTVIFKKMFWNLKVVEHVLVDMLSMRQISGD